MNQLPEAQPNRRELDDAGLAARIRAGDAAAFELLMRRYNRRLYRAARSLLRDGAEAEDAVQEAYLSAYRALDGYRGDAALATWLTRIVVNECMGAAAAAGPARQHPADGRRTRAWTRKRRTPWTTHRRDPTARPPIACWCGPRCGRCSSAASTNCRRTSAAVFMLRSVEELSVEETAECLGIPEATVRSRHFRARSLLRESIAQDLDMAERDVFDFDGERCDRIVERVLRDR